MKTRLLTALLVLGVIGGYGSGIVHLALWHRYHDRDAWKDRVADICVRAAERTRAEHPAGPPVRSAPREP